MWELHHPKGLVGVISPWNYPLTLGISDALPALVAGNAVLTKPDAQTPFTALWAVDLLEEAGLNSGVVQVVTGSGAELGTPIVHSSDFLMFTGSTAVGRTVAAQAGEQLIDCSMELGGKNALLVLEDADVDKAVSGAIRASFSNTGQLCISMERIYGARAPPRARHGGPHTVGTMCQPDPRSRGEPSADHSTGRFAGILGQQG